MNPSLNPCCPPPRRQLYGEDNLSAADDDHILHLGLGWAARVREYAPTCLQRCGGHLIHVRPLSQVDAQLGEGVVPSGKGVQQGAFFSSYDMGIGADFEHCIMQTAIPFLIGTKFDTFATFPRDEQEEITKQAKRFAKAMHASLIFCSTSASINVQKIFKIVLAKAFDLKCVIPEIEGVGEPVLLYVDV